MGAGYANLLTLFISKGVINAKGRLRGGSLFYCQVGTCAPSDSCGVCRCQEGLFLGRSWKPLESSHRYICCCWGIQVG